jgi:nonsense-mediated mRNA decay protein 3
MRRFCYRCGALEKDTGPLVEGLCQGCFSEGISLVQAPAKVRVVLCKNCDSYSSNGVWSQTTADSSLDEIVRDLTLQSLKVNRVIGTERLVIPAAQAGFVKFKIEPDVKRGIVDVKAEGKVHELQVKPLHENIQIKLNIAYRSCKTCSLKSGGYYAAILQVRGQIEKRELSKLQGLLGSLTSPGVPEDFMTDVKTVTGGIDVYVGSFGLGRKMSAFLKKLGAEISESSKLVGQSKDGKRKYRVTILARLPKGALKKVGSR